MLEGWQAQSAEGVAVQLEDVRRVFDNQHVVIAGMDLRIDAGEFLAVLGPSGCGKSTLLRMIARLAQPNSGQIRIEPNGERFQTAFVFQDAHLLPWRNVLANAALPLELMGEAKSEREKGPAPPWSRWACWMPGSLSGRSYRAECGCAYRSRERW